MANATTEEEPLAPGDAPADAPAEQAEQQTPIMEGGFPVPDVVALAAEFLAQLKEQIAETEGLEPLEDGWRCEVKIRAKITPMGPRVDKYFFAPDGKMLRSNAEVERYLLNRLEAERIAVEGPRTLRSRPPPRVREPVVNLDGIMSDLSDEEEEEDEDEDGDASEEEGVGGRGSRPARKKARKSAGQAAGGKSDGKPQKVLTPVSSEEQVKRYLYRTAKGQFGPFSLADFRGWKETMKQKGVWSTLKVFTLTQDEEQAVPITTLLGR